jgi:hypothetical protein
MLIDPGWANQCVNVGGFSWRRSSWSGLLCPPGFLISSGRETAIPCRSPRSIRPSPARSRTAGRFRFRPNEKGLTDRFRVPTASEGASRRIIDRDGTTEEIKLESSANEHQKIIELETENSHRTLVALKRPK